MSRKTVARETRVANARARLAVRFAVRRAIRIALEELGTIDGEDDEESVRKRWIVINAALGAAAMRNGLSIRKLDTKTLSGIGALLRARGVELRGSQW